MGWRQALQHCLALPEADRKKTAQAIAANKQVTYTGPQDREHMVQECGAAGLYSFLCAKAQEKC